jgi:hypothetical protein
MYEFQQFIADFGGYLGLLLGASIPSIYDYLIGVLKRIFKRRLQKQTLLENKYMATTPLK